MKKNRHNKKNKCRCGQFFAFKSKSDQNEDPVSACLKKKKKAKKEEPPPPTLVQPIPSWGFREEAKAHCVGNEPALTSGEPRRKYIMPKYIPPKTKKYVKEREEARKKYEEDLNFCKHIFEVTKLPDTPAKERVLKITIPSPEQSEAKVKPRALSPTESTIVAQVPHPKKLELRKPKSGIFINETNKVDDYDSFDLVYQRQPRPDFETSIKDYKRSKRRNLEAITEDDEMKDLEAYLEKEMEEFGNEEDEADFHDATTLLAEEEDTELTKVFRKKVEQLSQSTSIQMQDIGGKEETAAEPENKQPPVGQMTQKFRRDSEMNRFYVPPPKVKRGTLESHSYTKLKQPTLKEFFYGTINGSIHQDAEHLPDFIRNKQGLTMPVTAYCYALLKHPSTWEEKDIDEIIESGNDMYIDFLKKKKTDDSNTIALMETLPKYCYLLNKKIRYKLTEPQVTGIIKSEYKNIYNLTKGLRIFFSRYPAGIFQTKDVNLAIWRDKYYYIFDAKPRTKNLYPDPEGTALMANFYDIDSVISVLLDRCMFGNWPFAIIAIEAFNILDKNEPDETESTMALEDKTTYKVISEKKAVLQGSFELADQCFELARNKQALPMAAVALVYSRISPPNSWYKKIVDKIMIIGNELYLESVNHEPVAPIKLDQLPAEFTLGPYFVEIYVRPNLYGDLICRKGKCLLETCLEKFFQKYSMALVVLGEHTVAIWKQRGVYYCFDPYSRDEEGHKDRNGKACVSMHTNLDSLTWPIVKNYCEKDAIFYIHALVVCRIIREPPVICSFSPDVNMNGISMEELRKSTKRKGKRVAVQVPPDGKSVLGQPPIEIPDDYSLIEVDSNVGSLAMSTLPRFPHVPHVKMALQLEKVADLDSPSLSDTQIEPEPTKMADDEDDIKVDVDSYQLTMEEMEGKKKQGEGDVAGKPQEPAPSAAAPVAGATPADAAAGAEAGGDGEEFYMAANAATSATSASKDKLGGAASVILSAEVTRFMQHPQVLYPTNISAAMERKRRIFNRTQEGLIEDYGRELSITQSEELRKENNYLDCPDNSQIVRGTTNMAILDAKNLEQIEYLAPFVCIMAAAVAKKFSLVSWSGDVVDYVLKCGQELFKASKFRYDQVSRLDIPKISLGSTDFRIVVEYLFDTYLKDNILELALERMLFTQSDVGIFVTPVYAAAVFYRHHLFYLYDGYGNNEVGLSEGPSNEGQACMARFKDLHSLAQRIIYNKAARETVEPVEYTRFVISRVTVTPLNPPKKPMEEYGEDDGDEEWVDIDEEAENDKEEAEENPNESKAKVEVGWKYFKRIGTIRGRKGLKGRGAGNSEIKQDHFACICACLMLIEVPIDKWDSIKVDFCLDQGRNIFNHADDLCATEKRIIKNVLIRKHFFDIIVKKIQILNFEQNKNISTGIDTLLNQRYSYFIIQMVGHCNVLYQDKEKKCYYLFDPYAIDRRGRPLKEGRAGWVKFRKMAQLKHRIKKEANKYGGLYSFYTFEVTSIRKAPKGVQIGENLHIYQVAKPKKKERNCKPFHEEVYWLNVDPIPWSRMTNVTPMGLTRCRTDSMWHNWSIEYNNDLFSMTGNLHQMSPMFPVETRGKQTLCNLIMAIGMVQIYSLSAWNPSIIDSVLVNGDNYCRDCVADIEEEDYELSVNDLKSDCEIFPYSFKMKVINIVDGTMFLLRSSSFNLYKGLRYFFDEHESRFGIITVTKFNGKRQVAFGKTRELEYFMFDCEPVGAPMFLDGKAVAYVLRTTTLNRLLHVLTLTLRGGEFFIFEIKLSDFKPVA